MSDGRQIWDEEVRTSPRLVEIKWWAAKQAFYGRNPSWVKEGFDTLLLEWWMGTRRVETFEIKLWVAKRASEREDFPFPADAVTCR
jgi:hypothetical protein